MTLNEYLTKTDMTEDAFAKAARLSQSYVNRLRRGEATRPSTDALERIYEATGGAVTANDILGMQATPEATGAVQ